MRTTQNQSISDVLFGQVRRAILALLFTHSDESFYVRQIARIGACSAGAVHRELANLVRAGLVIRTSRGRQVHYQSNCNSPVFAELRGLVVKTAGVADVLKGLLAPLSDRITTAFVYGSVACGTESAGSDVDVMVIGSVGFEEVVRALVPAQDVLHREVNPSVMGEDEFKARAANGEQFVRSVLSNPKVMLVGEERNLRAVG